MDYTKSEIRSEIRKARNKLSNRLNFIELFESSEMQSAKVISSYLSYEHEPDTSEINDAILNSGRTLLLPRMLSDKSLEFLPWDGNSKALNSVGKIKEPIGTRYLGEIDVMLVPALAVDKSGNRLGQGGGSFDRALQNYRGWSVALINSKELFETIPTESHDMKVDAALTELGLVRFNRD